MTTNPTSSADTLSMSQQQMLSSVQSLQDAQKDLMHKYASATNQAERTKIASEMDKNEAIRSNLLLSIGSASVVSSQNVANKTDELNTKKILLQLANDEINEARMQMEDVKKIRTEKERAIQINTYYGKRFMAQAGVMKIFIYMCIPVLVLAILANMGFLPNYIAGFLIITSIVIGVIYIYYAIQDINRRDDMNFDEYQWDFDPSRVGPIDHPHRHHKKKESSGAAAGCMNDACCSSATKWNPKTNMCDAQGENSAVKGTSQVAGKVGATSIASNAASALLGDLTSLASPSPTTTSTPAPVASTSPSSNKN